MKNNKLICIILTLLVCLSVVVSASASETETERGELVFTLETTSRNETLGVPVVNSGETFVVNVNISANPGILYARIDVLYDSEVLELVQAVPLTNDVVAYAKETTTGEKAVVVEYGDIFAAISESEGEYPTTYVTGYMVALTFKVIGTVDAQSAITVPTEALYVISRNENGKGLAGLVDISATGLNVNVVGKDHSCDAYDKIDLDNAVLPSCTTDGKETDLVCSHCGAVYAGETIAASGEHVYDMENGKVLTEATCTETGVMGYYCSCGDEMTMTIDALGHDDDNNDHLCDRCELQISEHEPGEWVTTKEATCTEYGSRARTCNVCGEVETDDTVMKADHTPGEWVVTTEATEEAEGVETQYCSVCSAALDTRSIEKLPESADNTVLIVIIIVVLVLIAAAIATYIILKNRNNK